MFQIFTQCQEIYSNFMPMLFEVYGACSEKFEVFLKKMVKAASVVNNLRKRFVATLQSFNARLITQVILLNISSYSA